MDKAGRVVGVFVFETRGEPKGEKTMVAPSNPTYQYRLDEADVMVWVDEWWLAFAKENGAAELDEAYVLGRSIWDFVVGRADADTLPRIARVRSFNRKSHPLPFRCDSPVLQRYMQ